MTYQQSGSSFYHQVIVGAGADVTVRARGTFFHPADQQNSSPPQDSNYEVLAKMETIGYPKKLLTEIGGVTRFLGHFEHTVYLGPFRPLWAILGYIGPQKPDLPTKH